MEYSTIYLMQRRRTQTAIVNVVGFKSLGGNGSFLLSNQAGASGSGEGGAAEWWWRGRVVGVKEWGWVNTD